MGEELHSTEELPVRIFHPSSHDVVVAQIVLEFQNVQGCHQSRADARGACSWRISWLELALEVVPRDWSRELHQWMLLADDGAEFDFEEVTLRGGCGWFGLH